MYDLISVIVPIYNVEKYLDQCIQSICKQSYQCLEIILVDDGSTDKSGYICDKYATVDKRIHVIHQSNVGVSQARNAGLDIAKGKYIAFVDSDDYISDKMYEVLLQHIKTADADVALCNFQKVNENGDKIENISPIKNEEVDGIDILHKLNLDQSWWYYVVVWNRLYKRKIFDNIRFTPKKLSEDVYIFYDIFTKASKVIEIQDTLYFYRTRLGSMMNSGFSVGHLDGIEAAYMTYLRCEKENKELIPYIYYLARHQIKRIVHISYKSKEDKIRKKNIKRMYRYMFIQTNKNKTIKNFFEAFSPELYFKIREVIFRKL